MGNAEKVVKAKDQLKKEFEAIWLSEPQEVKDLKEKVLGPFLNHGSILLYVTRDTGEFTIYLHTLRTMALAGEVDIKSLASVTAKIVETRGDTWRRYYAMKHTCAVMQETALALRSAENKEELADLIQSLNLYITRFYYWLDETIPWASICTLIDWELEGK
jgi:hypothetical protein